jgi:hypothetical protein
MARMHMTGDVGRTLNGVESVPSGVMDGIGGDATVY